MKKFSFYILGLIMIASCSADPELAPIISIDNAQIGAFPRTLNLISAEYDLMNLATSAYVHDIDFRSETNGANVASYRVFVTFQDNDPSNGDDSSQEVLVQNFTQADFVDGEENRALQLNFPFTEMAALTGVPIENVSPGDRFNFRTELELDDARVFTGANTESTIFGPAFRAFFNFGVNATCPIADESFSGNYAITFPGSVGTGYGQPWDEQVVNIRPVAGSSTRREFDVVFLPAIGGFGPFTVEFDFVCDQVAFTQMVATGLSCTGGSIIVGPVMDADGAVNSPVDLSNDAEFEFLVDEGFNPAGCASISPTETLVRFTRQ